MLYRFWEVCSNLSTIWFNFSSVRTVHFLFHFRLYAEPVSLTLLVSLLVDLAEGTCLKTLFEICILFSHMIFSLLCTYRGEGCLEFPDLWSGQKPWWNWCLTPVVNFSEVRRAQLAKSTLFTSSLVLLGYFQIFLVLFRC